MSAFEVLKKNDKQLKKQFHLKSIGVFGSYATGKPTAKSDVDILVEYSRSVDFFEFLELKEHLEKLLAKKVDLVTKRALKPLIKKDILKQVQYV
jgi:hypothetical protein